MAWRRVTLVLPGQLDLLAWKRPTLRASQVLCPNDRFECTTLHCRDLLASVCLARQRAGDGETRDTWRGQGLKRQGACSTRMCEDGALIRLRLEPNRKRRRPNHWRVAKKPRPV